MCVTCFRMSFALYCILLKLTLPAPNFTHYQSFYLKFWQIKKSTRTKWKLNQTTRNYWQDFTIKHCRALATVHHMHKHDVGQKGNSPFGTILNCIFSLAMNWCSQFGKYTADQLLVESSTKDIFRCWTRLNNQASDRDVITASDFDRNTTQTTQGAMTARVQQWA